MISFSLLDDISENHSVYPPVVYATRISLLLEKLPQKFGEALELVIDSVSFSLVEMVRRSDAEAGSR